MSNFLVSSGDKLVIKYDCKNGDHVVCVELGEQLRQISFPTKELAGSFIRSIAGYRRLKVRV